ncbi:MAG: hypothetical protein UU47_C0023G0008 [candidate division TM6 bacterium GW2011_GWE2_41_16]|nr:MAG: hypothetical protein UU47_C0023G0008 [candidate division TM6 bacterium GW2011_GWE2_41_16]
MVLVIFFSSGPAVALKLSSGAYGPGNTCLFFPGAMAGRQGLLMPSGQGLRPQRLHAFAFGAL